jgi:hypothetical protein
MKKIRYTFDVSTDYFYDCQVSFLLGFIGFDYKTKNIKSTINETWPGLKQTKPFMGLKDKEKRFIYFNKFRFNVTCCLYKLTVHSVFVIVY